jgi:hypothetical protein
MTRVRVLREAVEEVRAIAQYYEAQRPGWVGRSLKWSDERNSGSRSGRWHRESSEAKSVFEPSHDFRVESTTEPARTKYSSSLLRIVDDDRDSGVRASSHITAWSERDLDKVLFQIGRHRVAQAERYAAQRSFRA